MKYEGAAVATEVGMRWEEDRRRVIKCVVSSRSTSWTQVISDDYPLVDPPPFCPGEKGPKRWAGIT